VHPFHHRPSYAAPTRAQSAVVSVGQKLLPDNNNATVALPSGGGSGSIEGVQDRVNRSVFIMPQPTHKHILHSQNYYHNYYFYLAFLFSHFKNFINLDQNQLITKISFPAFFLSLLLSETPSTVFLYLCFFPYF
jgi:hypothetical protein